MSGLDFFKVQNKKPYISGVVLDKTFYRIDSKGKVRVWNIVVDNVNETLSNIIVKSGIENGAMVEAITPITQGSNIGKANEKTIQEQALFDAESVIAKKIKEGLSEDRNNLKEKGETATIKAPMKGNAYFPTPDKSNKKDKRKSLDDLKIRGKRVGLQRKLDGWRLRLLLSRQGITFYTSSGDLTLSFPQIENSLLPKLNSLIDIIEAKFGVNEVVLDGEIYRHNLNVVKDDKNNIIDYYFEDNTSGFSATASACASVKNITPIKQQLRDFMEFHLFDIVLPGNFEEREALLPLFYGDSIKQVETYYVDAEDGLIQSMFEKFLAEGYEGLMIRKLDMPYEHKRTDQLTKYKPMQDSEFQIIGFKESIEGGILGSIMFKTDEGIEFYANTKHDLGSDAIKKIIWENQNEWLGKWIKVEFMDKTEDGSLRHPRAVSERKGRSKD